MKPVRSTEVSLIRASIAASTAAMAMNASRPMAKRDVFSLLTSTAIAGAASWSKLIRARRPVLVPYLGLRADAERSGHTYITDS